MGEQQRVATARALVVQETATALVATMDARRDRLFVEDGAMAFGLALATFVSVNASGPEHVQELLGRVVATAQAGVRAAAEGAARRAVEEQASQQSAGSDDPWAEENLDVWERDEWEPIRNEGTLAAARAVAEVHRYNDVGGHLHIVTDDDNVEDGHLDCCVHYIDGLVTGWMLDCLGGSMEAYRKLQAAEHACLAAMRPLSEEERVSANRLSYELEREERAARKPSCP